MTQRWKLKKGHARAMERAEDGPWERHDEREAEVQRLEGRVERLERAIAEHKEQLASAGEDHTKYDSRLWAHLPKSPRSS